MEKLFNAASIVSGVLGGVIAGIFGGCDALICALILLMALDYLTGVIKGIYFKNLSSEIGFRGLLKKMLILVMVALANIVEKLLGVDFAIRETVIMFYAANEAISILENTAEIMPNMPAGLREMLLKLRQDSGEEKDG